VRRSEQISFVTTLTRTPFDIFSIPFIFELTSETIPKGKEMAGKTYRFNIHENQVDPNSNICFKDEADNLPEFNPAYSMMSATLIKEKKTNPKTQEVLYEYVPKVKWEVALYREPESMIFTTVFPMILLNFFLCGVYFQEFDMHDKLANLSTILLAILTYLSVFRDAIPACSAWTFGDFVVSIGLLNSGVCLLDTVWHHFNPEHDAITVFHSDDLFWISSLVLTFLLMGVCIWYYIDYRIKKKGYDDRTRGVKRRGAVHDFNEWRTPTLICQSNNPLIHKTYA